MKYLRSDEGFTLVEVIVTATFVAMATTAIIGIFIIVEKLNKEARNLAIATALAEQKLETYRNAGYTAATVASPTETFTSSLPSNFGSPKSAVVNVTTPITGLKGVDVLISYTDDGKTKNVNLSTLMDDRGINR